MSFSPWRNFQTIVARLDAILGGQGTVTVVFHADHPDSTGVGALVVRRARILGVDTSSVFFRFDPAPTQAAFVVAFPAAIPVRFEERENE